MGLVWNLDRLLEERGPDALAALPFELPRGDTPPAGLTLAELSEVCRVLGCQPGELLSYVPETPAEQAAAQLSKDQFYQSFLAYREESAPQHD